MEPVIVGMLRLSLSVFWGAALRPLSSFAARHRGRHGLLRAGALRGGAPLFSALRSWGLVVPLKELCGPLLLSVRCPITLWPARFLFCESVVLRCGHALRCLFLFCALPYDAAAFVASFPRSAEVQDEQLTAVPCRCARLHLHLCVLGLRPAVG